MGSLAAKLRWLAVVAMACSSGPAHHPQPPDSPIVGDWFLCASADCALLGNHGVTWAQDGTWTLLDARGVQNLMPTGMYCASTHQADNGPYTFDDATGALAMMDELGRDAGAGTITFAPPMATLVQTNGITSLYLQIDPPRLSGPCPVP